MSRTIIITDSGCDIPKNLLNLLNDNIKVIPFSLHIEGNGWLKENAINRKVFLQDMSVGFRPLSIALERQAVLDTLNGLDDLDEEVDEIIFITSSGLLYPENEIAIKEACREYFMNHITSRIAIIDSNTMSMALGLLVMDASKMIDMQYSFDEIVDYVKKNKQRYRMEVVANDPTIISEHRVISARQTDLIRRHKRNYLLSMSRFGLLCPIMSRKSNQDIKNIMIERLFDDLTGQYAVVSTLQNQDKDFFSEYISEEMGLSPIESTFCCSNTTFVGTDSISLCYKKKK